MEALKNIFVLVVLLLLVKKRLHLGHAFLLASCLFGIIHQISISEMAQIACSSFLAPSTLIVLGSLFLINILEKIISTTGVQSRLVNSIKSFTGDPRAAMVILPGLVGLLPSPGGARFSAPMVKEAARDLQILPEQSAVINYYFRHIWEFFLPLYPANLIAAQIIGIPLSQFLLMMLPFMPATVLIGLLLFRHVLIKPNHDAKIEQKESSKEAWLHLGEGLLPVIAIIVMVIVFKLNILFSLIITISAMLLYYRIPRAKALVMLKESLAPGLFYMTFASIYLSDVLQQSGSIKEMLAAVLQGGLDPLFITIIFPLLIGLFTGITLPGITIAIPIILTLAPHDAVLTYSCLAFMSNFIGVILSPTHLCLLMSVEYFSANFTKTYRYLFLPETTLMVFSILYAYLLF
ncbi:MAG: DUF401 family protein [Peptococcia bacterium]|jgi:integral membrane protein (TIGR00529 family)